MKGSACRPAYPGLPPKHAPGMRIGLFGGSFNPAHAGHRLASLAARRRLQLDRVWWLVSPGNPLKDTRQLPPLEERLSMCARVAHHPALDVTGIEAVFGLRYTIDVIEALQARCPGVRFVWIMGADNLGNFHRWQHWRRLADLIPIAVVDRPGSTLGAAQAPAGAYLARFKLPESAAGVLADFSPPAFVFLHDRRSPLSSTALRTVERAETRSPKVQ